MCRYYRPGSRQSARRSVHQRPPAAEPHPAEDRRVGGGGSPSLRHLPAAARLSRLRVKDPQSLPGDGQHPAGSHRRIETQEQFLVGIIRIARRRKRLRNEQRSRTQVGRLPTGEQRQQQHLLLGIPRPTSQGKTLAISIQNSERLKMSITSNGND